jgi:hypothetical protein
MEYSTNIYTAGSTFSFEPFFKRIHISGYAAPDAIISWTDVAFSLGAE